MHFPPNPLAALALLAATLTGGVHGLLVPRSDLAPTPDVSYVVAGCGTLGGMAPAQYCYGPGYGGANDPTCTCSSFGVYGCTTDNGHTPDPTDTTACKSKGCGCLQNACRRDIDGRRVC